jgi:Ca-activated chloride channel family protein
MKQYSIPGALLLLLALVSSLPGQGRIVLVDHRRPFPRHVIPRPPRPHILPVQLRSSTLNTRIEDRIATTRVCQQFYNPNNMQLEGEYIFPLPPDATLGKFSLTAGGKVMKGEVLPREKARGIYEDIVRKLKDPALLEYLDWGLFKARVFPIPPRGEVSLTLTYESILETDAGLTLLRHPFTCPGATPSGGGKLVMKVDIKTSQPLKSVYSPSHSVEVVRKGSHEAVVSYEGTGHQTGKDFLLYYSTDARPFGVNVLTHKKPGEPGFFLAMISPKVKFDRSEVDPKDILLVLDTSGSMKGEKIKQAKAAARFCLQSLDPRDRFNLICFSTDARHFRDSLIQATPENVKAALAFIEAQEALGGTNIHEALLKAVKSLDSRDRVGITLFLTDGIPTIDVIDKTQILTAVKKQNSERNRIFVFGVGSDVNTHLLDNLAEQNRGTRTYVGASESIEVKVSAFYEKVRYPVLSDLKLEIEGTSAFDVYPKRLPDLFKGTQLLVLGRYTESGHSAVRLSGRMQDKVQVFTYEAAFKAETGKNGFIPRLWAMRKVGFLLDQVRLNGPKKELTDSIVALGKRYGIVTPYTSFLVIEDERQLADRLVQAGRRHRRGDIGFLDDAVKGLRRSEELARREGRSLLDKESGDAATSVSRAAKKLRGAVSAPAAPSGGGGYYSGPTGSIPPSARKEAMEGKRGFAAYYFARRQLGKIDPAKLREIGVGYKVVGGHTFLYVGGIWMDTLYEPETMRDKVIKVEAFSRAYFDLLKSQKDLGKLLTVGPDCIICLGGKAYHVFSKLEEKKAEGKK